MEFRTFHSTPSIAQQPIRELARTEFRVLRRLGNDYAGYVSTAFYCAFDNGRFALARAGFHDFARAIRQIVLLSPLRFFVSPDEPGFCANQGLTLAIFGPWRASLRGLASNVPWLVNWQRPARVFRTTEFARCATSVRTSENRIFFALARWAQSIAYKVSRLFPCLETYPQNLLNARRNINARQS